MTRMLPTVAWFVPGPRDLTGRLVSWASRSRYCHVGLAIDDTFYEALAGGVRAVPAAPRLAAAAASCALTATADEVAAARDHAGREAGRQRYDYLGFANLAVWLVLRRLGLSFPLVLGERDAAVCSAFVAECLALAGYDVGDPRGLTPGDLAAYFHMEERA